MFLPSSPTKYACPFITPDGCKSTLGVAVKQEIQVKTLVFFQISFTTVYDLLEKFEQTLLSSTR